MRNRLYSLLNAIALSGCTSAAVDTYQPPPAGELPEESKNYLCTTNQPLNQNFGQGKLSWVQWISGNGEEEEQQYNVKHGIDFNRFAKTIISNADGSGECFKYDAYSPTPSPDGSLTLYVGEAGNYAGPKNDVAGDVFLMTEQGTTIEKLGIQSDHSVFRPSWKPDQSAIAYSVWEDFNHHSSPQDYPFEVAEIHEYNFETQEKRQLTSLGVVSIDPVWCGDKIVFGSRSTDHIYSMNPDGSDIKVLSEGKDQACSPDQKRIAFSVRFYANNISARSIWTMNLDGSEKTNLSKACSIYDQSCSFPEDLGNLGIKNEDHTEPSWSPDGQHIAYVAFAGLNEDLRRLEMVVVDEPSQKHVLTSNEVYSRYINWSPEGRFFAYLERKTFTAGKTKIKIMDTITLESTVYKEAPLVYFEDKYFSWSP